MIRGIVAIDSQRGMAGQEGLPWSLPKEAKYFVETIQHGLVLMGHNTYLELDQPFADKPNFVATRHHNSLRSGFIAVHDARRFLTEAAEDVWSIGGPSVLQETMDLIDEFYITQIFHRYNAIKFLPPFEHLFTLAQESDLHQECGVTYAYQVWKRRTEG